MPIRNVYVIPHGDEIIEKPNEDASNMFRKIRALASKETAKTLIVLSPHGVRISDSVGVVSTQFVRGDLGLKGHRIRRRFVTDSELAAKLSGLLPGFTRSVSFITSSGPQSEFPIDFGSLIPLYFFNPGKVVLVGQPRITRREILLEFGKRLYEALDNLSDGISIIFSADQAHTHSSSGPYGYSPDADAYHRMIVSAFESNDFSKLPELSEEFIENAKPDSYWNMIIMLGLLRASGIRMVLDFHYVERYFGMLLAHSTNE